MTLRVEDLEELPGAPWIRRFAVRTPTLPPATHTNVYVIGESDLSVVDPASPWSEEQERLDRALSALAEAGHRVREILLTHHHVDHVSGAAHLSSRLGVPVLAHAVTAELTRGRVEVARTVGEGEVLRYGSATLTARFTPGHAPGHLVFVDEQAGAIVAGDMVASVGTIIIDPPEGDMRLYLASLERLRGFVRDGARWLLPSHGPPIGDPEALLAFYVKHRLEREAKVVAAMQQSAATVEELVPRAYPEVAPAIYPLAARSLLAHLLKLRDDGRAVDNGGVWSLS